ncbi:hypothetical protein SCHPADRAFT_622559 [Schizopora paradoxa]|uniref:Uncharacterized protein n=1 Tax=Schizopora paradoxa TaxID=27342 RepID=A0A0H2RTC9_9AGAM|nr:hypothetical protein SCHPADRAFT_622559 [Schizopora paradoxa]
METGRANRSPILNHKRGSRALPKVHVVDSEQQFIEGRQDPPTDLTSSRPSEQVGNKDRGYSSTALNVAKVFLSLTESAAEAIPVVGSPIKAAIGGVLKIFELFDVKGKNKKQATRLIRKLKGLDMRLDWAKSSGLYSEMSPHLDELTKQLNGAHDALKDSYIKTNSIIRSSSVAEELSELEKEIDDFLSHYTSQNSSVFRHHGHRGRGYGARFVDNRIERRRKRPFTPLAISH